ncbi:unnamed protein product [Ceratitis capitata]|uniref:(Mediterranean fruit fly) hypothetical protein n=1 Tax=Ceratitis capitata TaxID=7213 RepID=A0A811UA65_CERCA|nr:unnamed protein product [Ceratitis capitata]
MCDARIVSTGAPGENIIILKGGDESDHKHPPNRDECEAEVVKANLKRKAEVNPEQPPAQILRLELPQGHIEISFSPPNKGPFKVISRHNKYFMVNYKAKPKAISVDRLKPVCFANEDLVNNSGKLIS